jgi:2,5-diketo-D-gluconate reductase B
MAEGHAAIPASTSEAHLRANLAAADLRLDAEEVARIRTLDRGRRAVNPMKSPRWND